MANERNPNDPYARDLADNEAQADVSTAIRNQTDTRCRFRERRSHGAVRGRHRRRTWRAVLRSQRHTRPDRNQFDNTAINQREHGAEQCDQAAGGAWRTGRDAVQHATGHDDGRSAGAAGTGPEVVGLIDGHE